MTGLAALGTPEEVALVLFFHQITKGHHWRYLNISLFQCVNVRSTLNSYALFA